MSVMPPSLPFPVTRYLADGHTSTALPVVLAARSRRPREGRSRAALLPAFSAQGATAALLEDVTALSPCDAAKLVVQPGANNVHNAGITRVAILHSSSSLDHTQKCTTSHEATGGCRFARPFS